MNRVLHLLWLNHGRSCICVRKETEVDFEAFRALQCTREQTTETLTQWLQLSHHGT